MADITSCVIDSSQEDAEEDITNIIKYLKSRQRDELQTREAR